MYNLSGDVFSDTLKSDYEIGFWRGLEHLHNVLRPISEMLANP